MLVRELYNERRDQTKDFEILHTLLINADTKKDLLIYVISLKHMFYKIDVYSLLFAAIAHASTTGV